MPPPNLQGIAQCAASRLKARYLNPLGAGAFKSAHLVELNGNHVALKVAALGPHSQARIERECNAQRECAHPSIARLMEAFPFTDESGSYWVWIEEYLGGGTLEARRVAGILPPNIVGSIAAQMIGALEHLRVRKLVHRDIKPANIIFRTDAAAVLTDFGIVRALDLPTLTQHFMMQGPGTPAYAAPEQLNNDILLIDGRTDQFGLAVVLSECLLGHHPYAPEKDIQIAIGRVAARCRLPSETARKLTSLGFESLIRALEPWPAGRYRLPSDFLAATPRV
jgi:serine/threonine protein kinase